MRPAARIGSIPSEDGVASYAAILRARAYRPLDQINAPISGRYGNCLGIGPTISATRPGVQARGTPIWWNGVLYATAGSPPHAVIGA